MVKKLKMINTYLQDYIQLLNDSKKDDKIILEIIKKLKKIKLRNKKVIIVGNGGSAAIASHFSVDLTLNCKVKCINFNDSDLITCFANDFGYENWTKKAIELYGDKGDVLIAI